MMEQTQTGQQTARLIAAHITSSRFRGRAELLRLAERGDESALRALELPSQRAREIAALRGELSLPAAEACAAVALARQRAIRASRARLRASDPIEARAPGKALDRATRLAFEAALKRADFRRATHAHQLRVRYVPRGKERAWSVSSTMWARDAGLSNAYAKKAYRVATSEHGFEVSPDILRVPRAERAERGLLYLSPTVRVRQGRGTALVLERRTEAGRWS